MICHNMETKRLIRCSRRRRRRHRRRRRRHHVLNQSFEIGVEVKVLQITNSYLVQKLVLLLKIIIDIYIYIYI